MKIKKGRTTITNDVAYIAGFFDGEGCVRIKQANQGGNSYYVWVAITNSHKPTLDYIASIFGGKVRRAEKKVNKWVYHYLITASEAVDMLKTIRCFVREKRKQVDLAISFHEKKGTMNPARKKQYAEAISAMKHEVIGNIYENENLLKTVW